MPLRLGDLSGIRAMDTTSMFLTVPIFDQGGKLEKIASYCRLIG